MILRNEKGVFDMDGVSSIAIERTNPLLNEQGSMSLPFPVKRTRHNDYLLDHPDRYDRKNKYNIKQTVSFNYGINSENASLELTSCDSDQVECVLYLNETTFYSQAKEVTMPTVFDGIIRWFQPETVPEEDRVVHIVDMLNNMIFAPANETDEFTIFPAVVEADKLFGNSIRATELGVMNMVVYKTNEDGETGQWQLRAKDEYTYTDSEENEITLPVGYGVSPFLRLNYVLRKVFEYFGFTLEENIFDNSAYKFTCVLNNTMDAILKGCFIESQLVPDCTVNEFLDIARENFCGDFIIDVSKKTARLVHFDDMLDAEPDQDLTPYLTSKFEKIEWSKPVQIKLVAKTGLPYSETETDTIAEFIQKYPQFETDRNPEINKEGVYADYKDNSVWKMIDSRGRRGYERLGSLGFSYSTLDDIENEEHQMAAETIVSSFYGGRRDGIHGPLIGSQRNLNSYLIFGTDIQKEETVQCPVMLSLESYTINGTRKRIGVQSYHDFEDVRPPDGYENVSLLPWDENGLFNKFWKRRDRLCRNSFHTLTYMAKLPAYLLYSYRFERMKVINGQPLIPYSLRYNTSDDKYIEVEMLFKTAKNYE